MCSNVFKCIYLLVVFLLGKLNEMTCSLCLVWKLVNWCLQETTLKTISMNNNKRCKDINYALIFFHSTNLFLLLHFSVYEELRNMYCQPIENYSDIKSIMSLLHIL